MKKVSKVNKGLTLFDHVDSITVKKTPWEDLSESDRKSFIPFMINRCLSMHIDLLEIVNYFQKYTVGLLRPREVYKLYSSLLPQKKLYYSYVKGKKNEKYNTELIKVLSKHYSASEKETIEYLDILFKDMAGVEFIISILEAYGYDEKRIEKLIK